MSDRDGPAVVEDIEDVLDGAKVGAKRLDPLVRRYEATRRKHPLGAEERVSDGIARERVLTGRLDGW